MKLSEIVTLTHATIFTPTDHTRLESNYDKGFACDLMSDVLAYVEDHVLLITGLVNEHSLRTATMLDIDAILFVRGKKPTPALIEEAIRKNVTLLGTNMTSYQVSGILYNAGLGSLEL
ncbi:hypothetical protein [Haloplasma contractile]|nr:hypothetical protein [Haloplasma contractile]